MQALYSSDPADATALSDADVAGLYAYPNGRTWVRANFVSSLDGAVQGPDERAASISDAADERVFALLRSLADVVVVGAGTARAERYAPVRPHEVDTALRQRLGLTVVPSIAVVSRSLDLSAELLAGGEAHTLVFTTTSAPAAKVDQEQTRAEVVVAGSETIEPTKVVEELTARGFRRILLEGGPQLMRSFVAAGRCDELCLTLSALLVGGEHHRLLRGGAVDPPEPMRLRHLLEEDGTLFCRYTRDGG